MPKPGTKICPRGVSKKAQGVGHFWFHFFQKSDPFLGGGGYPKVTGTRNQIWQKTVSQPKRNAATSLRQPRPGPWFTCGTLYKTEPGASPSEEKRATPHKVETGFLPFFDAVFSEKVNRFLPGGVVFCTPLWPKKLPFLSKGGVHFDTPLWPKMEGGPPITRGGPGGRRCRPLKFPLFFRSKRLCPLFYILLTDAPPE